MLKLEKVNKTIEKFRDYVIRESKNNLKLNKKNYTSNLSNSIKGEIVSDDEYTIVGFSMDHYGLFVDKGVKGADPSKVSKNAKITGQQAPNSPYSFKDKRPPSKFLEDWAKKKNIRLRDEKGRFKKGSYKTIGMIIAKNIWARGIKPSLFFTKPFESGYKKYIDTDLIKAFGQDIDTIIDYNLKDIK
jgi:hypothetical protein